MAWARLSDLGIFGVDLDFRCSEPALAASQFEYLQPCLKASLHEELLAVSDGAGRLQLASQDFRPLRRWLRIKACKGADGRRLTLQWRRAGDPDAPELKFFVEPASRTYRVGADRSLVVQVGTSVDIEYPGSLTNSQHGVEMLGLLTYVWAMFERDRRATA